VRPLDTETNSVFRSSSFNWQEKKRKSRTHKNRRELIENKAKTKTEESATDINSIQYVIERLDKLRPSRKKTLMNSIRAMYQFQGAISEEDQETIIDKLEKKKFLKIESNNRVTYL